MVTMDLEDLMSLPEKCREAVSIFGKIDILINNAGVSYRGQIEDTSLDVDHKVMVVNYFGHVAVTKGLYFYTRTVLFCLLVPNLYTIPTLTLIKQP